MHWIFAAILFLSATPSFAGATGGMVKTPAPNPIATSVDPACIQNKNDPYDLGWRLTTGSAQYAHKCLNTKSVRPVKILKDSPDELQFANFYQDGQYWTATWKKSSQPKVQFYGVHFGAGIPLVTVGHSELHFRFPDDVDLVSQTTGEHKSTKDIVISWEAVFPKGVSYNLFLGIQRNYAVAGRVLSLESRIPENTLPDGKLEQIDVYDLHLSPAEGADLFQRSVRESSQLAMTHFYDTLGVNCTSELFYLADSTLHAMDPKRVAGVQPFHTDFTLDSIIGPARKALIARGLIAPNTAPMDLATLLGRDASSPDISSCTNK